MVPKGHKLAPPSALSFPGLRCGWALDFGCFCPSAPHLEFCLWFPEPDKLYIQVSITETRAILSAYLYTFPALKGTNLKSLFGIQKPSGTISSGSTHAGSHTVTSYRKETNVADPQGSDKSAKDMDFSSLFLLRLAVNTKWLRIKQQWGMG